MGDMADPILCGFVASGSPEIIACDAAKCEIAPAQYDLLLLPRVARKGGGFAAKV